MAVKINYPPKASRKGDEVYRHKTRTVTVGGKQVPEYILVNEKFKSRVKSTLKDYVLYDKFGETKITKKVKEPKLPKTTTDVKTASDSKVEGKQEDEALQNAKTTLGQPEAKDESKADSSKGNPTSSEGAKTTKSRTATRAKK